MLRVPVSEPDIVVDRLCPSPGVGFGLCKSIGDCKDNGVRGLVINPVVRAKINSLSQQAGSLQKTYKIAPVQIGSGPTFTH